jgi:GH25 family lysozyme M1 (1,4-beta-N-acetylmuramidase)
MEKLLEFLAGLVKVLFGRDSESPAPETPRETPVEETVTGWEGDPPYRYIDVSRYQGKITLDGWRKVKAAGYKGVMLKTVSTNRKLSKRADGLYIDPTFETNYKNARAAGLDVGVYYYTYATSEAMADAELALVRQAVYGKELTMPLAVDVEDNKLGKLDKQSLTDLTAYALHEVEQLGFYAQLYTYTSFAKAHLFVGGAALRPYDVWLADYTGKTPNVTFNYNAHQHISKGAVPGISGNVDLNVTTLNYPRIIRKKGLTRLREGK